MATNKYNMYNGIDFSDFEPRPSSYERNAARKIATAPAKRRAPQRPQLEIVRAPKRTSSQARNEMRRTSLQTAKILSVAVLLIAMLATLLYGRLKADELDREISSLNTQLEAAQSENVRLNMEIESVISLKNVEDYAQSQLGMVKMEANQIEYIDLSGDDVVTLSGDKTVHKKVGSRTVTVMEYIGK